MVSCHKYRGKRCTSLYTEFDQSLFRLQKVLARESNVGPSKPRQKLISYGAPFVHCSIVKNIDNDVSIIGLPIVNVYPSDCQ